ncbi:MAG: hypothetical protein CMH61_01050 [Nanoarchaeota archaeon]|nr:hypothetical protein [Nanoarchaeota archaeon]|tara:strand:+ start:1090 stop:1929 length:840 start_codon:yes stop_codon:yes gene_type:complete
MKLVYIVGLVSLFIIGCGGTNGGDDILSYDFKKGISEIDMTLLDGLPPDEVYDKFNIGVELQNNGAYDASFVELEVVGFNDKYVYLPTNRVDLQDFRGKSFDYPSGQKHVEIMEGLTGETITGKDGEMQKFFVIMEYQYGMELVQDVCINPSIYEPYNDGCEATEIRTEGQGSPLSITTIQAPIFHDSSVDIRMKVENKGQGKVKEATITNAQLGSRQLQCEFSSVKEPTFNFEEKQVQDAEIVCKRTIDVSKSFPTPLFVSLDFIYQRELIDQITIKS